MLEKCAKNYGTNYQNKRKMCGWGLGYFEPTTQYQLQFFKESSEKKFSSTSLVLYFKYVPLK